jgi:hypothetical protein
MTWLAALEYAEHRAASPAGPEQMSESEAELEAELAAEREFIARRKALTRKLLGLTRPYR